MVNAVSFGAAFFIPNLKVQQLFFIRREKNTQLEINDGF